VLLGLLGCAHGTLSPSAAVSPDRLPRKVGTVTVTLDPAVPAERRAVYERFDGNRLIAGQIIERLRRDALYDEAGADRVDVRVDVFRLRSPGNAFWNGFFAGIDRLEGEVVLARASAEPATYAFKLSGREDAYLKFSAGARFRSLARALGAKVSAVLRGREPDPS
jgi:hypothetical protein